MPKLLLEVTVNEEQSGNTPDWSIFQNMMESAFPEFNALETMADLFGMFLQREFPRITEVRLVKDSELADF